MSKKYALAVVIGRMQPIHNGHMHLIQKASELADNLLVLFGDTGGPRTIKNPFHYDQRGEMLQKAIKEAGIKTNCLWSVVFDDPNDQVWIRSVVNQIQMLGIEGDVCIVGHKKDKSSAYIDWFPQYDKVEVPYKLINGQELNIDATKIRDLYFTGNMLYILSTVPVATYEVMSDLLASDMYKQLKGEYEYIQSYKKSWEVAPYPVIFSTVDAVVIQSGHVLLVRRGKEPGKGLLALPGGFLDQNERMFDASIRELREETGIKIQDEVLARCYKAKEIFDDPGRSLRGRTVSTAFLFKLNDACELPTLRPGKDPDGGTIDAQWVPLSDVGRYNMFEDHYFIIEKMIGML
jgi:bifunctional NMN adenylyltransferase/nudix hydrolase